MRAILAAASTLTLILAACSSTQKAETPKDNPQVAAGNISTLWAKTPTDADLKAAAEVRTRNPNFPDRTWWRDASTKPDSFYLTPKAREMAENMLTWQDQPEGGWPLMNTTRDQKKPDASNAGPWGANAAMIGATVNEIRFLARGYRATKDERYKTAVLDGINFILKAQYPTGGWPHSYPLRDDYSRYATYNDDMMPDLMTLLNEVATSADFELVGSDVRAKAKTAFDKGVDFILKSQLKVAGKPTVWCQQHDEVDYSCKPARAFEPAAPTGGESASVLRLLMSIPKPSAEVKAAVEGGVQWYRDHQINGVRVVTANGDRHIVADASASPLWARYYDPVTDKPIFVGRDGVKKYAMAEIEQERRAGYAWYGNSGVALFERYAAWTNERRWDNQPATNIDETKVGAYKLPDVLTLASGQKVKTVKDWETKRRPEIMKLLEQYQEGVTPTKTIPHIVEVFEEAGIGLDGIAKRHQVRIKFPGHDDVSIRVLMYTPAKATGPVPTLLHLSFQPNVLTIKETGLDEGLAWSAPLKAKVPDREARVIGGFDARTFVERGFGVAVVYYGDIYPDFNHGNALGVTSLFGPPPKTRAPDEWGATGAWSWGLSRVMDYLQTDARVNPKKIAVSGASRLGKTVLWTVAQDQRFALAMPLISGEGGASISRRFYGETIADLTNPARYDYWFAPRYQGYAFKVDQLPVDGHMLLAMAAPRPVLQVVGTKDTWSDPKGEYVAAKAAEPVWKLYGKKNLKLKDYPKPDTPVLGDMGFFLHDGEHAVLPPDYKVMADFMELHFGKQKK